MNDYLYSSSSSLICHHHAEALWVERAFRKLAGFLQGLRLTAEQLTRPNAGHGFSWAHCKKTATTTGANRNRRTRCRRRP